MTDFGPWGGNVSTALINHYRPYRRGVCKSRQWAIDAGYLKRGGGATAHCKGNPTRMTSFDGGVVSFPYDKRITMLEYMAEDAMRDEPMYWNMMAYDRSDEGMRLVVDVDSDVHVLTPMDVRHMMSELCATLRDYYHRFDEKPIPVVGAVCGPRLKKGSLSLAVHFVAHVIVTVDQAKQILFAYKLRIFKWMQRHDYQLEIDAGVYRSQRDSCNLRPIFCHKIETCPSCEKNELIQCALCGSDGTVVSTHTYRPFARCMDGGATIIRECSEMTNHTQATKAMVDYGIWADPVVEQRDDYRKPDGHPSYELDEKYRDQAKSKSDSVSTTTTKASRTHSLGDHDVPMHMVTELQKHMRSTSVARGLPWEQSRLTRAVYTSDASGMFVSMYGPGSGQCPYANKDHGEGRVYWLVRDNGKMSLYCRSRKDSRCSSKEVVRLHFFLPFEFVKDLFPKSEKAKKMAVPVRPQSTTEKEEAETSNEPSDTYSRQDDDVCPPRLKRRRFPL